MNTVEKIILVLLIIIFVGASFIAINIIGLDKIKSKFSLGKEDLEVVDGSDELEEDKFDLNYDQDKFYPVNTNELITKEGFCEFSFDEHSFKMRVEPPNLGKVQTYYEIKDEGNIYLDIPVNIKSLLTEARMSDQFMSGKIIFNGEYEYNPFMIIEEHGGSRFTYTNIKAIEPLKTHRLHFLAELPKEVAESESPLDLLIKLDGTYYKLKLR